MSRTRTALVGEGPRLHEMLAGLSTCSRLLRLKIVVVVDLDPGPESPDLDQISGAGIKEISTNLDDILTRDDLGLVILGSDNYEVAASLRNSLSPQIPVLGPESETFIKNAIRLAEDNRALHDIAAHVP